MNSNLDNIFNSYVFSEGAKTTEFKNKFTGKQIQIPKLKLDHLFKSKEVSPIKKSSFLKSENAPSYDIKLNLNKVLSLDQTKIMKNFIRN
jgi:hypothetical protein